MSDDHKKPVWPWIVALLIGLPVLYVLSVGPISWLYNHEVLPRSLVPIYYWFYAPIAFANERGPEWLRQILDWYADLWT